MNAANYLVKEKYGNVALNEYEDMCILPRPNKFRSTDGGRHEERSMLLLLITMQMHMGTLIVQ